MTRTDDTATVARSRRSVLAAVAGAAASLAAASLGRPLPAAAADGDPLLLGQQNQANNLTELGGDLPGVPNVGGLQRPRTHRGTIRHRDKPGQRPRHRGERV